LATVNNNFRVKNGLDAVGDITTSGDVKGNYLRSLNSSGDEGGEIFLAIPQTNTTLAGTGVTIDLYQNRLRFFEQGGSARGYYIDITGGGSAASTNLVGGGAASDSFKTIAVSGQGDVVADSSSDTLTLVAGTFVTITTVTASDSITFSASHSHAIDDLSDVTITSVTSGQVLKFSGSAWVNSTDSSGGVTAAYNTIAVSGQGSLIANSTTDTLTFVAGTNVTIITNTASDSITIAASGGGGGGITAGQSIIYAMVFG
jgi:hypothetical protein